jgi:polyisoprenoid-binding protein YceI
MKWITKYSLGIFILVNSLIINAKSLPEWQIIPEKSSLTFKAVKNTEEDKEKFIFGAFKRFKGEIFVDPSNYKDSSIHMVIDIASLSSADSDVVDGLTSPEWLDPDLFPKADFKAIKFNKLGDKTYQADGFLTIRDKSAPVTLIFTAKEKPENYAVIEGETVIKRTTFGIGLDDDEYNNVIKDEISIYFNIVAIRKK